MKTNRLKHVVATGFLIALMTSLSLTLSGYAGGQGTEEDPWQIETEDHLISALTIDNDRFFIQIADIELESVWFNSNPFSGNYNGNGNKISGVDMYLTRSSYMGLIPVNYGIVRNLHVEGSITMVDENRIRNTDVYAGLLIGKNYGLISRCSSFGIIEGIDNSMLVNTYAGGLVGKNSNTVIGPDVYIGKIVESFSRADVVMNENGLASDYNGAGGLVGLNDGLGEIENSYATGNVSGVFDVGGFVAYNNGGSIENSYSIGEVSISGGRAIEDLPERTESIDNRPLRSLYIGGFSGYCTGTVSNSYWDIETSFQQDSWSGEGRTTNDMTYPYDLLNTYIGWDFVLVWGDDVDGTLNDSYPVLWGTMEFAGGDGDDVPYLIAIPWHLNNVRRYLDANFELIADIDLGVPPWNEGEGWVPIGQIDNEPTPFTGSFNGNGFSIGNLLIDRPNDDYQGLFGIVSGEIYNLTLTDIDVTGNTKVGGVTGNLIGEMNNIIVSEGRILGVEEVGGVIGLASGIVEDCHSDVLVRQIEEGDIGSKYGGLIGHLVGGNVNKCSARGNVEAESSENVGGLIGLIHLRDDDGNGNGPVDDDNGGPPVRNDLRVDKSYAVGNVTGREKTGGLIGGICLEVDQQHHILLMDNYASQGIVSSADIVGGLIGKITITNAGRVIVRRNYSTGQVISEGEQVGGLIGIRSQQSDINWCYWDIESSRQTTSAGGEGLTTVKMMQQGTYPAEGREDWDFLSTWAISEWYNENPFPSYPYLRCFQNPEPSEHNKPINFDPFFGEDGRGLYVNQNRHFWVSFPWISRDEDGEFPRRQTFEDLIKPLEAKVDSVGHWNVMDNEGDPFLEFMEWDDQEEEWDGNLANFCSIRGYKIRFDENPAIVPPGTYRLPFYGTLVDPLTEIPVYEVEQGDDENWVGFFLPLTHVLPDALGPYAEDFFETIQTQWGTMVWDDDQWNQALTVQYGEMVKLTLREGMGPLMIQWHDLNREGRSCDPPEHTPKPVARYFPISYGPSFESLFIEDICFDEDIVEIGVYAGEECIGAAVFEGEYPLEVLAYTNRNHSNENLSLVLYVGDGTYIRYNDFPVRELGSREYARLSIRPLQSKYSFLKIDRTGGERSLAVEDEIEEEDILPPAFGLSQNYPNPFSLRTGVQGQRQTSISLSLPQDMPVSLNIYNIRGQLVRSLISGEVARGEHTAVWNGKDNNNQTVGSGIYFYRLETDIETITRKMLIVR